MPANPYVFDICVIGSGPGGGTAAYVAAKAGAKTVLLEAGPRLKAGIDYNAHKSPFSSLEKRLKAGFDRPVSSVEDDYGCKNHFVGVGDRPGHGQIRAVGGRSLCWAGHALRFGPLDFRNWPISYDQIAPFYEKAERLMAVYGERDGLSNLPDGVFQRPVPLRCGEWMLKRGVEAMRQSGFSGSMIGLRKAIPTDRAWTQRATCHYCGHCRRGCEVDAKFTTANTCIPLALKTGNLSLMTNSMMTALAVDRSGRRVTEVIYRGAGGQESTVRAKHFVLACSTIETARHLLHNRSHQHPSGLGNSTGLIGRNLSSHFSISVFGFFPQIRSRDYSNDDGTDYQNALLTGLYWDRPSLKFEGTYQIQCGSGVHPLELGFSKTRGFGVSFKRSLLQENICHASLNMQATLARAGAASVDLDPSQKDVSGIPLPRVHLQFGPGELAMAQDMAGVSEEVIGRAGGRLLWKPDLRSVDDLWIDPQHWVGSTPMGSDPKTSVVDGFGRLHELDNVTIADASVFTKNAEKNPTLTNMALAWRSTEEILNRLKRGELEKP